MRELNRDPDCAPFPNLHCFLNAPISRDEVRMSVYKAGDREAPGADEIPSEVPVMTVVLTYFLESSILL